MSNRPKDPNQASQPEWEAAKTPSRIRVLMELLAAAARPGHWLISGWVNGLDLQVPAIGGSAATSRIRDLRKKKYGSYKIARRYISGTGHEFEYRVFLDPVAWAQCPDAWKDRRSDNSPPE